MEFISKWWKLIAPVVLVAALFFVVDWYNQREQKIGYDRAVTEYTKKDNEALKAALSETKRLQVIVKGAEDAAKKREDANRSLSARNAVLLGRLRDSDAAISRAVSGATAQALADATRAIDSIFADCRGSFEEMGRAAAGHFDDAKKLSEAWPE